MARIPTASRESVPQDQLAAFDELVSQRGSVPDIGPIAIMINVPELTKRGEHLSEMNRYRYDVVLHIGAEV